MHEIDFFSRSYDVFSMFDKQWALATAGTPDDFNTLTIGWGSLGMLWGRPVVTIYVSPARYTFEFLEKNDSFTVTFFPKEHHQDLLYLGSHSGRDGDKVAHTALTPIAVGDSVGFEQAELTFVCKKLYADPFEAERTPADIQSRLYAHIPAHYYFVAEIMQVLEK